MEDSMSIVESPSLIRVRRSVVMQLAAVNGIASRALPLHFRLRRGAVAGRRHVVADSRPLRRSEGRRRGKEEARARWLNKVE